MMHVYESYYILPRWQKKGFMHNKEIWDENSTKKKEKNVQERIIRRIKERIVNQ